MTLFSMFQSKKKETTTINNDTNQNKVLEDQHYVLKTNYKGPFDSHLKTCVFATGCFWGSEKSFWRLPGVHSTAVGYINGTIENPTYNLVCSGRSGHTEAVLVVYDPTKISFTDLVTNYFLSHDPTQGNGQGNDRGTQYRSGAYVETEDEKTIVTAALKTYEKLLEKKITSEVVQPCPKFYHAEEYHQQYLAKPGSRPYCSAQPTGKFMPEDMTEWVGELSSELKETYAPKLPLAYWKKYGPKPHCVLREPNEPIVWEK